MSALANPRRPAIFQTMTKRETLDPSWHKSRIAARIWMKAQKGGSLSAREKRLARKFADDRGVENRLIQQGVLGALGGPYRIYQTRTGPKPALEILDDAEEVADALGRAG